MKKNILFFITLLLATTGLFLYVSGVLKNVGEMDYLKVKFYKLDRSTLSAEKYAGTAEWEKGKYKMDIVDPDLKKILRSPFSSKKGMQVDDRFETQATTLKPGTLEHLKAVARELKGYVGIMITEKNNK
ncbi:MAG: hypothetical protein JW827_00970 [Spirochaetes bacterium]|nr:hypothetical protein [Spirochaetota bacterium]